MTTSAVTGAGDGSQKVSSGGGWGLMSFKKLMDRSSRGAIDAETATLSNWPCPAQGCGECRRVGD